MQPGSLLGDVPSEMSVYDEAAGGGDGGGGDDAAVQKLDWRFEPDLELQDVEPACHLQFWLPTCM